MKKSYRIKEQRNIVHTVNRRTGNWIGHILCRNYLLKRVIEGKVEGMIEVTGRRGKRGKQLLNDLNEERNFIHTLNRRKGNWIGHILCGNCLLKQGIEGKVEGLIEVTGRRERRLKQLLDDLKEERDIVHTVNRRKGN